MYSLPATLAMVTTVLGARRLANYAIRAQIGNVRIGKAPVRKRSFGVASRLARRSGDTWHSAAETRCRRGLEQVVNHDMRLPRFHVRVFGGLDKVENRCKANLVTAHDRDPLVSG